MANKLVDLTGAVFARLSVIENSGAVHRRARAGYGSLSCPRTALALPMLVRQ